MRIVRDGGAPPEPRPTAGRILVGRGRRVTVDEQEPVHRAVAARRVLRDRAHPAPAGARNEKGAPA